MHEKTLNSLSPTSDPHPISPNINTAWPNRCVMRINEINTKDHWCLGLEGLNVHMGGYMSLDKFWMVHCLMIDSYCYASEGIATCAWDNFFFFFCYVLWPFFIVLTTFFVVSWFFHKLLFLTMQLISSIIPPSFLLAQYKQGHSTTGLDSKQEASSTVVSNRYCS